jgi:fatty acid desaturase
MLNEVRRSFARHHGPTWLVAAAVYGGFAALTLAHERLPLPVLAVLGGIVIALHGSLQHETIHGHPGGARWIAPALGAPPLSLWLPYPIYRDSHHLHHATAHLTDPAHDPEAPFRLGRALGREGPLVQAVDAALATIAGRLLLGPFLEIGAFLARELGAVRRGRNRRVWLHHLALVLPLLGWVCLVAGMPLWKYLLAFVYPGTSLGLLRSFAEHRPDPSPARRTVVIEAGLFFRLLFLNNNLHAVHHRLPRVPWFALPRVWRRERADLTARAPDLVLPGYGPLLLRHALRPRTKSYIMTATSL